MVCLSGKVKLLFIGFKFVLHNFAIVKTMQTLCIMKRILTTLMAILLMCLTGLSFADEVTKIIIIEKPIVSEGNKNVNRAPAKPQIEGYYSSFNIYFYDYTSAELILKRAFDADVIQGYSVDGRNHILYSYCNKKGVCSEYDMISGLLEKSYLIKPQRNHNKNLIMPIPYVTTISPIGVGKEFLSFIGLQAGEPKDESNVNRPVVLLLDVTSGDVKYRVNYPSVYQKSNWGGRLTYRLPYYTLSPEGDKMLISFAACDSITVYDIVRDKTFKVYCGSGALKSPKPYSKKKYDISSSGEFEWYMKNYSYEGILYDRYRQCYYRFGRLPFDDYKPTDRINKKPTVVIVMDSTMTVVGEYCLPDKHYIPGASFVSKEGLNIQVYSNNENIMLFDVFSLI